MKVHHLNCATICSIGGRLISGRGGFGHACLVCHCLLVETPSSGLVLVDTGFGLEDIAQPRKRLGPMVGSPLMKPRLDPEETAARRVEQLGFSRKDVRHIVVTHLDLDHAGGLSDFPEAVVHVHAPEYEAALKPRTLLEKHRYRTPQWAHQPRWARHSVSEGGERWLGFDCVRDLEGLPPEVLLVPVGGHTRGHAAVAVRAKDGWLLHAGDAYFHRDEMASPASCPAGLAGFQRVLAVDNALRKKNQARLRELALSREARVFSAHDAEELKAFGA